MICLANPQSRSGRGRAVQSFWRDKLAEALPSLEWRQCLSGDDCRRQAGRAGQTVVAVGGDGTINNVINGLMVNKSKPSLGVLYSGTSPDFCKFHQIPLNPEMALAALLEGQAQKVDIAQINFHGGAEAQPREAFFASSCNIGLGADTAEFANRWRRYLGDLTGTGLGLLKAMGTHQAFRSEIIVDGQVYGFEKTNHIIVFKNPHIASSLHFDLDCRPDDGYLRVVVIHNYSRLRLPLLFGSMYAGSLMRHENVFLKTGRRIEVRSWPAQSLEFDGDPQGQTPARVEIRPQALSVIVPMGPTRSKD